MAANSNNSSSLLLDRPPEVFQSKLAMLIGLDNAIVLQKLHYLVVQATEAKRNYHDGHYWVYNSIPAWQKEFWPWWSERTIRRIFQSLKTEGIIIIGRYNRLRIDQTTWYSINYNHSIFDSSHAAKMATSSSGQHGLNESAKMATPIPAETPANINSSIKSSRPDADPDVNRSKFKRIHKCKQSQTFDPDGIEVSLANRLLSLIKERYPGFKTPIIQIWAQDIDKLLRLDKRPPDEASQIIDWCQSDRFWRTVILSPAKLRAAYDQLWIKYTEGGNGYGITRKQSKNWKRSEEDYHVERF
jgi:hypothetical protein